MVPFFWRSDVMRTSWRLSPSVTTIRAVLGAMLLQVFGIHDEFMRTAVVFNRDINRDGFSVRAFMGDEQLPVVNHGNTVAIDFAIVI